MTRTVITDHYELQIDFNFTEKNQYGDRLEGGSLRFTKKLRVGSLADVGKIIATISDAVDKTFD